MTSLPANGSVHHLTVDLEDWTTSSVFLLRNGEREQSIAAAGVDPQVERGTRALLELLSQSGSTATFFTLGCTAARHPNLIREIHDLGHEIGSHSEHHPLFAGLPAERMRAELEISKHRLEDLVQGPVLGFRAPNLSVSQSAGPFFAALASAGYRYDSSYTDVRARRIFGDGWASGKEVPGTGICEVAISSTNVLGRSMALGGTRLALIGRRRAVRVIETQEAKGRSATLYVHPYELDRSPARWAHPAPSRRARAHVLARNLAKRSHVALIADLLGRFEFRAIGPTLEL